MTVDKFGHYYNHKYNSEILKKNVSKTLGIIIDSNNNIDIQNRKIKNLAPPSEGSDAVNKDYLYSQINHIQEVLKRGISKEVTNNIKDIKDLNQKIKDIYDVIITISSRVNGEKIDSK